MKAVIAALAANLGIAIAKFAAFLLTGSASMLAEAVHSVADTSNQGLLLWGQRQAGKARRYQASFDELAVLETKLARHQFDEFSAAISQLQVEVDGAREKHEPVERCVTAARRSFAEIEWFHARAL